MLCHDLCPSSHATRTRSKVVRGRPRHPLYGHPTRESALTRRKDMADYLFLFRGGMQHESGHSPAELQASTQKWMTWIGGIGKKGQLKGGQPLENGGKVI